MFRKRSKFFSFYFILLRTTKTMSETQLSTSSKRCDQIVIETFRAYNRSQLSKIAEMDNGTLSPADHEAALDGRSQTEIAKTLKKFPIYCDWVQTLLQYNNELIEMVEQKGKLNDNIHSGKRKLININHSNDNEPNNEKLGAENAELKKRINQLELQKQTFEEAAVEARVLVLEVAERHDIIVKLKNELNEMEQLLMQKDTHIQFKDKIIRELRQQRRNNFKCPHSLIGSTKLDSIDKVVDLIRTVSRESRDISPDSLNGGDCSTESYQQKENQQIDKTIAQNVDKHCQTDVDYAAVIEFQQAEIDHLKIELEKMKSNYDRIFKMYNALNQQLDSITPLQSESPESQIEKMVSSTMENGSISECTTAIADKTHLANLITSLKTELATATSLLQMKEKECNDSKEHFKRNASELRDARKRIVTMEKQSENYRETIRHLQENLNTHSDTIHKLEENQTILKLQFIDSQEKQRNFQKLFDENRKLESELKHQLTTITFLRTALEDHLKLEKNAALKTLNRTTTTVTVRSQPNTNYSTAQTTTTRTNNNNNNIATRNPIQSTTPTESSSTSLNRSTANTKWNWWKS